MAAATLAAFLFALSVVFASRTARILGSVRANLYRLCLATVLLGLWAHWRGPGLGGGALGWFFLSGCIGFGLGDMALYQALPRVGPRLTGLLVQCLAAPFAGLAEWFWLGIAPTPSQILAGLTILCGVGIAVAPREHLHVKTGTLLWGIGFGLIAALGQGLGAVVSRKAYTLLEASGGQIDGLTAAYQRILGGLTLTAPLSIVLILRRNQSIVPAIARPEPIHTVSSPGSPLPIRVWIILNTLAGPVLGVGCYQWALATAPSGLVLPIVATMPILVIPLAWALEGDRPTPRSILGGLIAVTGVVGLTSL